VSAAADWPQQAAEHPFDGPASEAEAAAAERHERTHRQSSQDTVTGLDGWKRFRAANFRSAAASWAAEAAHLRASGGSAQDIAAADLHARRFGRDAQVYGPVAS
jgi:hypothetical protein